MGDRFGRSEKYIQPSTEPPFDRHDWVIRRPGTSEEIRYVIDYYTAGSDESGSPVFSLDVRPALDSWGSTRDRIRAASGGVLAAWREKSPSQPKSQGA